ncbi:hypothetical protein GOP47_0007501 [Adiantum capillus-veneris]|uniref:DWNN domain-containing protein n=1 Tax=Adiantum capillus-veneris TaxID=13818 RepID=A0A9D4ZKZ8_ADICA|nr:hypothetical protein GOP47_0007501 [Adiantum capillus-veneris]
MAVYFKFKSAKDYDSISIDGHFISVGNLKDKIVEKKNLGRGTDFDLLISNAQTNEEYTDEAQSIPRNTSVLVRRVPGRRQRPIVAEVRDEKVKDDVSKGQASPVMVAAMPPPKQVDEPEWGDEFGVDLYAMPENPSFQQHLPLMPHQPQQQQLLQQQVGVDKMEEDNKIKAFVDASATDWQRQTQEILAAGKGFGRGQGRGFGGRGYGRSLGPEKKNPPPGYICHRCGIAGHFIQHCVTNGDPAYDVKKMKPPTGIPKSMLVANPDGSYALPSGTVAILRPNEAVFDREVEGLPSSRNIVDIPFELRCPLCKGVLKDAVLTSRCCFKSYCDRCIRDQILSNGKCVCGATNVLADDLLPNKTLRDAIARLLETTTATSSADHPGSLHVVQDMESAQRPKLRAPSPSASGSQRLKARVSSPSGSGSQKTESVAVAPSSTDKAPPAQQKQPSLVISINHRRLESMEQTAESVSRLEPGSQDVPGSQTNTNAEEEVQQEIVADAGKKRKLKPKRQKPLNGEKEGYYRSAPLYEPMADGAMMPYAGNPALYGNFWAGPQYMLDGFGQPILNPQYPIFGYGVPGPVPCDMLYGAGMMLPEPVGHPACVPAMPPFQRDDGVLSREEFEARKAELKRKRELEQRSQKREEAKLSESGDLGSSKLKRMLKISNSSASSPPYDASDVVQKVAHQTRGKIAASSSSPEPGKRKRPERREETFERVSEDQMGFEANEKKPKGSVFSRISFPAESKDRPKRPTTEKFLDGQDEVAGGSGSKGRRIPVTSPQDPGKLSSGRKAVVKDDRLRITNRVVNKSKLENEADANDDDAYERNFKHRTSYSTSPRDVNIRVGKRRQL